MSGCASGPISTGPPAPISIRATAQDERAHDLLAERNIGNHEIAQALRRNYKRLHFSNRLGIDEQRPAGQIADLNEKLAFLLRDYRSHVPQPVPPGDSCRAGHQHNHAGARLTRGHHDCSGGVSPRSAKPTQDNDLLGSEFRKHLLTARVVRRHGSAQGMSRNSHIMRIRASSPH